RAFAEKTGVPVALTVHGLGGFPSEHFLCLHMLGMHGTVYANYAINSADLLLALGVRFDDRVTGKVSEFAKHGKIVHIDIDPSELNKNKAAHLPIHGDLRHALLTLNRMLAGPDGLELTAGGRYGDWVRQVEAWRGAGAAAVRRRGRRHPAAVRHRAALAVAERPRATGRHVRHHRRRPAPDVGGPVLPLQPAADVDHVRRAGGDGVRPAGGAGGAGGPPG